MAFWTEPSKIYASRLVPIKRTCVNRSGHFPVSRPTGSKMARIVSAGITFGFAVTRIQWNLLGGGLMKEIGIMLLLTATSALNLAAQKSVEHVKTYTPDAIHWGAAPNALPSGAQLAVLEGDPTKPGAYTMRLKMSDGYKIPPHHHLRREHVTVISGAFKVGMGDSFDEGKMNEFAPGSFAYLEPTAHHYAMAKGETVIQLHGAGPWEIKYVNPADDPRGGAGSGKTKEQ